MHGTGRNKGKQHTMIHEACPKAQTDHSQGLWCRLRHGRRGQRGTLILLCRSALCCAARRGSQSRHAVLTCAAGESVTTCCAVLRDRGVCHDMLCRGAVRTCCDVLALDCLQLLSELLAEGTLSIQLGGSLGKITLHIWGGEVAGGGGNRGLCVSVENC
jgi:hypothetical protein